MKTSILIIQLFIFGFASGQKLNDYYSFIYKAEDCILSNQYDSASFYYSKAMKYKKPFGKDTYNFLVASIKSRQLDIADKCIRELIRLGATINSLSKNKTIQGYIDSVSMRDKQKLASIKITYNKVYRSELKKLQDRDQQVRKDVTAYTTNKDITKKVDKENTDRLLELIKKYGFPSEQKIGIDEQSYEIPYFPLLMIHQRKGEFQQYDFSEILTNAYKKGQLHNKLAYHLVSENKSNNISDFTILRYQLVKLRDTTKPSRPSNQIIIDSTDWFIVDYTEAELEKLNKTLLDFNLEPFIKKLKKSIYSMTNSDFLLGSITTGTSFRITDEKEFFRLKEKYKKTAYNKGFTQVGLSAMAHQHWYFNQLQ
jgi:hypothetical protein